MIIAGEVSGDLHAAELVKAVRRQRPDIDFFGIGGERMRGEGVETLYDVKDMAVMGIAEVLARYGFFRRVFHEMLDLARRRAPRAVILVDYPGFNLRFAKQTHRMGLKNLYYICPQVWAWKASRIPKIVRDVDHLMTILPFEPDCFKGTDLKVDFVGHPLVDAARASLTEPLAELPWTGEPRVALLPGSRRHEIERILPVMWDAANLLEQLFPESAYLIACPDAHVEGMVRGRLERLSGGPQRWAIATGQTHQVLRQAKAALVASGTATLDAALMRCPTVITYRVALSTYLIGRAIVRISYVGLVNIVADRAVFPELLQHRATPEALARAVAPLLEDTPERETMLRELDEVVASFGSGGAADNAARIVVEELETAATTGT